MIELRLGLVNNIEKKFIPTKKEFLEKYLDSLIKRIDEESIKEVIIAVKPSVEGETTALYISKILEGKKVTISKIAHGVPLGADMDYVDALTLEMALEERKNITSNSEE